MPENNQQERRHLPEIESIKARLDEGDREMKILKESLIANTQATQIIAENTAGFIELYKDLAAGTRLLCRWALAIRWILETIKIYYWPVVILTALIWAITHNFQLPPWFLTFVKAIE